MKIQSLNIQNHLQQTQKVLARSLERLSSGSRLNRFSDGPADMAQLNHLNSQIRGQRASIQQVNEAQGMLQSAESNLSSQLDLVQRMRELALQAANGSTTSAERDNLDIELQELVEEYKRIALEASFHDTKLLDGSFGSKDIQVGANKGDQLSFSTANSQASKVFQKTIGTGEFSEFENYETNSPEDIVLADINGNGILDKVVANEGDDTVSVFLGNGDGSFQSAQTFDVGGNPAAVAAKDLTGNGILDLVATSQTDGEISVLLGNGDGSFQSQTTFNVGSDPESVSIGDFNGNGVMDVVTADRGDNTLSVLLGNGDGSFQARDTFGVGSTPTDVKVGDLDGNGIIDIVATNRGDDNISVLMGNGDGSFETHQTYNVDENPESLVLADLNGNGILDVAVANNKSLSPAGSLSILLGAGDGSFGSADNTSTGINSIAISSGDLNGDGSIDLIVSGSTTGTDGPYSVFTNDGSGSFEKEDFTLTDGDDLIASDLGDLNGDGVLDIVFGGKSENKTFSLLADTETLSAESDLDITTQENAEKLVDILDDAIDKLNELRTEVGSQETRFDFTHDHLLLQSENLEDARSKLADTDFAFETSELVRAQVLQQAQVASLAQANLQRHSVLDLLP